MIKHHFHNFLSPAKLNLGLKIVGKREDGYHLLKSVFCLIDLFDEIEIQVTNNGKVSLIEHNQAWFYKNDLAYKAAVLLHEQLPNSNLGANIRIKKIIPSGSGMGGGSSNAATTLIALNQLWNINLDKPTLIKLGTTLGADVPFFIYGKNALVSGIGEQFEPLNIAKTYFVIIKPSFNISTKTIFTDLDFNTDNQLDNLSSELLLNNKENDLLAVANKIYPQLKTIYNDLSTFGKPALTGSGSALYLSFNDKQHALSVYNKIKINYNSFIAQSIKQSPLY
jgi:4-diphosphocytidyl-2-C-methyl-D-erythritol kinase